MRDRIGDILVQGEGGAQVLVDAELAEHFETELTKAGDGRRRRRARLRVASRRLAARGLAPRRAPACSSGGRVACAPVDA